MRRKQKKRSVQQRVFVVLAVLVLVLGSLNIAKAKGLLIPEQPALAIENNVIHLADLTLEQKIAQMVIVHGGLYNKEAFKSMQIGGIHLFALQDGELYKDTINQFQTDMQIPFFVSSDLEGCLNPFSNFFSSPAARSISTIEQAFEKGKTDGAFLKELGFSLNFAPVVDLDDQIWRCRSFPGNAEHITELARSYSEGLQGEGILATAKHYPGKTLVVNDPHKVLVSAEISSQDLLPYEQLIPGEDVGSIMVSHIIVSGAVDSSGVPSVVSLPVVGNLKEQYGGLIISDDTMMLGLRNFYDSVDELYVAVFRAGNDLIINFDEDPLEIYRMIQVVSAAVERGEISEEQIDASVRKILTAKGFKVE
ncbi:hypothetical protein COV20_04225 [Candidatus Woesearchaeota archaeon CG10_big_fil_rev_8_21_14_0_10_45_16]|nr:MAG: hypothetical protein COV20_04225 [Candidatus Woesearchaeota archaeon CG10_big_fil_rev_8_21_14_0_10_45_16]